VILWAGRIQPLKRLELAVRALAEPSATVDKRVTPLVVGGPSGPAGEQELRDLKNLLGGLGLGARVRFKGVQPYDALPATTEPRMW
jgi:glycosyltransferase involved in cell wall biosynthesis